MPEPDNLPLDAEYQLDLTLDQILQNTRPEVAEALLLCAVPHWFDEALVAALRAEETHNDKILNRFERFTFVSVLASGRFAFHDNVRMRLLARLDVEQAQFAHQRAYDEMSRRLAEAPADQQMPLILERLYHQLAVDRETAVEAIQQQFDTGTHNYNLALCESLVTLLREQPDASLQNQADYYESQVDILNRRLDAASQRLSGLLDRSDQLDGVLYARVLFAFAVTESLKGHWLSAIDYYRQSYDYFKETGPENMASTIALDIAATYSNFFMLSQPASYRHYKSEGGRWVYSLYHLLFWPWATFLTWQLTGNPFGNGPRLIPMLQIEPLYHAITWYRKALSIPDEQVQFTTNLAIVRLLIFTANFKGALRLAQSLQSSPIAEANHYQMATMQRMLTSAYLLNGRSEEGEELASASLTIFDQYGDRQNAAGSFSVRGLARLIQGKRTEARDDYQEAIAIFRALDNKIVLGQILQQLQDLDESLVDDLDIEETDRVFVSYQRPQNQNAIYFLYVVLLFIFINLLSLLITPNLPFWIGIPVAMIGAFWLTSLSIVPIVHWLLPLSLLREAQTTLILLDEEKVTQLQLDEVVRESIPLAEVESVTLYKATYWSKPTPRGSWLKISTPNQEIVARFNFNQEFHQLVARLEQYLAPYDVNWARQGYAYMRSVRTYVLTFLYLALILFGATFFAEMFIGPAPPERTDTGYLITTLVLIFVFQFGPGLAQKVWTKRPFRIPFLFALAVLAAGAAYLAWTNSAFLGMVALTLALAIVVQVGLWVLRFFFWLLHQTDNADT